MEHSVYADLTFPFTKEWYEGREHAPHAEQAIHRPRMEFVAKVAAKAVELFELTSIVDLGCGDGGLLQMIRAQSSIRAWGYDLQQNNVDHARSVRGVDVRYLDFVDEPIDWGDLTVITECLEHLADPHGMVRRIAEHSKAVVASSPSRETAESHDACHAWVWDMDGYRDMFVQAGFRVQSHAEVGGYGFQVIVGVKP
jgi:2-polyprenyl-3-methyl-5-hydroxy-6-metoxy-1,4-benzoquinol methylase